MYQVLEICCKGDATANEIRYKILVEAEERNNETGNSAPFKTKEKQMQREFASKLPKIELCQIASRFTLLTHK